MAGSRFYKLRNGRLFLADACRSIAAQLRVFLKLAIRSLLRAPLRSGLTALGLVIGVSAFIATVSIGSGARAKVEASIAEMDSNRLVLIALTGKRPREDGQPDPADTLNVGDYLAIRREIPGIEASSMRVSMMLVDPGQLQGNGRSSFGSVMGTDPDDFKLAPRRLLRGSFFGAADLSSAANVCIISATLAERLYLDADPIGQHLRIMGAPFRVIGLVADRPPIASADRAPEPDTEVIVPFTSLMRRINRNVASSMMIFLRARTPALLPEMQQRVLDLMEKRRGKRRVEFGVSIGVQAVETYTQSSRTLSWLLACIAGISLLAGGVGIMNTMLMNVTDRTREIGIRIAVGARGVDVLGQFLVEAVLLGLLGGMGGILLGIGAAEIITRLNGWPTLVTANSVLSAFLCSLGIGILFGYYPAQRAAGLRPIAALRSA